MSDSLASRTDSTSAPLPSHSSIAHASLEQTHAYKDIPDDDHEEEKTTTLQTYVHLVKGYVGPGCLSLPWAFSKLGILGGIFSCILISYWTSANCYELVKIKRQWGPTHMHTYPEISEWAYGKRFKKVVTLGICVQQLAVCTVFLSFVGENILAVMSDTISHGVVITLALPAVLALSCLGNLKKLAPVTMAATFCLSFAFVLLFIVLAEHDRSDTVLPTLSLPQVPLAMCAILYSYEGICLILPVEGAMKSPKHFGKVFWAAMATACAVFCVVATWSVVVFGNVENGSITAFLLESPDLHRREMILIANTFVSVSILLTYPLQLYPCLELVGAWIEERRKRRGRRSALPMEEPDGIVVVVDDDDDEEEEEYHTIPGDSIQLRFGLVFFTYLIAISIPNIQQLIALSGALAGSTVALIIPPLIELQSIKRSTGSSLGIAKCCISCFMGTILCLVGTGASILDIVRLYTS